MYGVERLAEGGGEQRAAGAERGRLPGRGGFHMIESLFQMLEDASRCSPWQGWGGLGELISSSGLMLTPRAPAIQSTVGSIYGNLGPID